MKRGNFSIDAPLLWGKVINKAKQDLVSSDNRLSLTAARYFFLEPVKGDDCKILTFTGLCDINNINADTAAKAVFAELNPDQQKRIMNLLRFAGYGMSLPVM